MTINAIFRVDADNEIGFGHLSRCIALADVVGKQGGTCKFILGQKTDADLREDLQTKYGTRVYQQSEHENFQTMYVPFSQSDSNVLIFDTAHHKTIENIGGFVRELNEARKHIPRIVVFDTFGRPSLRQNGIDFLRGDIIIIPYVGDISLSTGAYTRLIGAKYFVVNPCFEDHIKQRTIRQDASRILITCGGLDVTDTSIQSIHALNIIQNKTLDIHIIIGPGYSNELIRAIEVLSNESLHNINLVRGSVCLAEEMTWCDLCISMTGLTKYELAATGTPALLLSIDKTHSDVHADFDKLNTAHHLGIAEKICIEETAFSIISLLNDCEERKKMSALGQKNIDGRGTHRIVEFLEGLEDVA